MKRFGRTEGPPDNLWWVIYEAPTEGDFAGGDKVAAFKRHADAKEFLNAAYETSHASRVHADEAVLRLEADLEAARVQYNELLYAVEQKEPGKSRHGTALDLIRRGQRSDNEAAKENPAVRAAREGK